VKTRNVIVLAIVAAVVVIALVCAGVIFGILWNYNRYQRIIEQQGTGWERHLAAPSVCV
jgi:uncharacterized membrane protein